jgi:hypothetical protein
LIAFKRSLMFFLNFQKHYKMDGAENFFQFHILIRSEFHFQLPIKEEVQYSKYNNMKPNNRSTHI